MSSPLANRAQEYIALSNKVLGLQPDSMADPERPMSVIEDMSPAALLAEQLASGRSTRSTMQSGDAADAGPSEQDQGPGDSYHG